MEFHGLPLHPLIVHVVVVFAPLSGVGGLAYALVPRWRWWLRWPFVAASVIAVAATLVAVQAGQSLENARGLAQLASVRTHASRGHLLRTVMLLFLVPAALSVWMLGGSSALASGVGARATRGGVLSLGVAALLVAGSVAVLVCCFLAGDSGARAVWGQ
jgi:hypothetical protein